ncbi:MAG: sigma-54 dependent transcriptional regulator [Deltaproteobacteria bacterium]|nr:sigma-54 dependent transcriptional regulator [Deltaproteobacteria bacterium]
MRTVILIVDDEESIRQSLYGVLTDEKFEVIVAASGEEALQKVDSYRPHIVLLDIWLPGIDGIETLKRIKMEYPQVAVIMISGHGTIETAVKATKLGAVDFIEKPLSIDNLILSIKNVAEMVRLEEENKLLKQKIFADYDLTGISVPISELKERIEIVAPTNAWILIMGENGTGKELVARAIHKKSRRRDKSFVEVNCAAIPEELIESELFGHEKGAFTGATARKQGKFEMAHEGTIFLDEVADMSPKAQAKTLRVLQEKTFERVGGNQLITTDVRVLAATNKDIEQEMEAGRFRQDLFYRLNVIPLNVPPLRERRDDIPILAEQFLTSFAQKNGEEKKVIDEGALQILMEHSWQGNVRELKNIVERLAIMTSGKFITAKDVPSLSSRTASNANSFPAPYREVRSEFEKQYIESMLKEFNGNISKTAEAIGIERSNLHRKIRALGIEVKETI